MNTHLSRGRELSSLIPTQLVKNSKPDKIMISVERQLAVERLKETYSKRYLLSRNLVTRYEYRTIPASPLRKDMLQQAQDVAEVMNHVVGY